MMPRMFSSVKNIARNLKSGRFFTEFGICVPDGNPNSINTIECNAVMNAADKEFQSWTYWNSEFFDESDKPIDKQVKPFVRMYPLVTAGEPISLEFDTFKGSGFYAFSTTEMTVDLAKRGEIIASIYLPLEIYYQQGYKFEVEPNYITYNTSSNNDHLVNLFGPSSGLVEGIIVEVNISAK